MIAKGNIDALSDIYDSIGRQIYFIAYSVLKNHHDAEDVLQEVLYKIVKCAHTYKPLNNARAWILSIARNQAQNIAVTRRYTYLLMIEDENGKRRKFNKYSSKKKDESQESD